MELLFQWKVKLLKPLYVSHLAEMILVGSKYSVWVRSIKRKKTSWTCFHFVTVVSRTKFLCPLKYIRLLRNIKPKISNCVSTGIGRLSNLTELKKKASCSFKSLKKSYKWFFVMQWMLLLNAMFHFLLLRKFWDRFRVSKVLRWLLDFANMIRSLRLLVPQHELFIHLFYSEI